MNKMQFKRGYLKDSSTIILLLLIPIILLCKKNNLNNISKIRLNTVLVAAKAKEQISIKIYLEIPYKSLQFVKREGGFVSGYEAQIAVINKNNELVHNFTWSDSIRAQNYLETIRKQKKVTLYSEKFLPTDKYDIIATILDLESREFYKVKKDIKQNRSNISYIFKPIVLLEKKGEWGFKPDLIPSWNYYLSSGKDSVHIFISGICSSSDCELNWKITSKIDDEKIIANDYFPIQNRYIQKYIKLPISIFSEISYSFSVTINDRDINDEQLVELVILKPGISNMITDINEALNQMKYILTSDEKEILKNAKKAEKDQLFKSFWDSRDPTSETLQNELMDEYYKRIAYTKEHFSGFQEGWKTDMGMIYILFGYPDEVKRYSDYSSQKAFENWYYFSINKSFKFVDVNGFGDYQLESPHFLSVP